MSQKIIPLLVILLWMATGAALCLWLAPALVNSRCLELILLAYLIPQIWLVASLLAYITWANTRWKREWDAAVKE